MMPITASTRITGVAHLEASGNSWRQKRSIAKVPTLSTTAVIRTATGAVDSPIALGSQVCSGHSGAFTAKAKKKPRKSQRSVDVDSWSRPSARAWRISVSEKVPVPNWCAVAAYRPITAASMIRPPTRLYSRNFTAA